MKQLQRSRNSNEREIEKLLIYFYKNNGICGTQHIGWETIGRKFFPPEIANRWEKQNNRPKQVHTWLGNPCLLCVVLSALKPKVFLAPKSGTLKFHAHKGRTLSFHAHKGRTLNVKF